MDSYPSKILSTRLRLFLWIIHHLRPYRPKSIAVLILVFAISFCSILIPKTLQYLIDTILSNDTPENIVFLLVFIVAIIILTVLFQIVKDTYLTEIKEYASRDIQFSVLRHLRRLGIPYYESRNTGDLLTLMNTEANAVQQIFKDYLPNLFQTTILLMFSVVSMLMFNPLIAIGLVPFFLMFYLIGVFFERNVTLSTEDTSIHRSLYEKKIYENITSMLELRAFGQTSWYEEKVATVQRLYNTIRLKMYLFMHLRESARRLLIFSGAGLLFGFGIITVKNGLMSVGEFVSLSLYYFLVIESFANFVRNLTGQQLTLVQAERVYRFMMIGHQDKGDEKSDSVKHDNEYELQGNIVIKDLHFSYNHDKILNSISLEIKAGEKVALVGLSGSGKTTLMKLLSGIYKPDSGEIYYDGNPLSEIPIERVRDHIGCVFQENYLFGKTVRENLLFGHPSAVDKEILEAARSAYAHDFIELLPQRYDTILGERGYKLSGGQKQRIAIARMFIKNPSIIMLDEATSALDTISEKEVQMAINKLLVNRTTITVAHRLTTVQDYDKIVVLNQGKIVEVGNFNTLLSNRGAFYKMWQAGK